MRGGCKMIYSKDRHAVERIKESVCAAWQTLSSGHPLPLLSALSCAATAVLTLMPSFISSYSPGEREGHLLPFAKEEEISSKYSFMILL